MGWRSDDNNHYATPSKKHALPLELDMPPVTCHNLITIHLRRSGSLTSTQWHRTQVFQRVWRTGKFHSCSNMGDFILCISQLCGGARNHSVNIPSISLTCRTGIPVSSTQLTVGVLPKQLRMVTYRTFSPTLLQFR